MLRPFGSDAVATDALEQVRAWTRSQFGLAADAPVFVSEVACSLPGCPPLETIVGFWTEGDVRHHFKIFKRVAEVVRDDLPPGWLKDALIVDASAECAC